MNHKNNLNAETVSISINKKDDCRITIIHDQSGSGDEIRMNSETFFALQEIVNKYKPCDECKKPVKNGENCDKCHSFDMYRSLYESFCPIPLTREVLENIREISFPKMLDVDQICMKSATINGSLIQGRTFEEFKESALKWEVQNDWFLELVWKYLERHSSCSVYWNSNTGDIDFCNP